MANDLDVGRDVYAGDTSLATATTTNDGCVYEFVVGGDADPDVLARVSNLVSLANVAPLRVSFQRIGNERVTIVIELDGITAGKAESIHRKLAQLTSVNAVSISKRWLA
jgi:hypothetical protein